MLFIKILQVLNPQPRFCPFNRFSLCKHINPIDTNTICNLITFSLLSTRANYRYLLYLQRHHHSLPQNRSTGRNVNLWLRALFATHTHRWTMDGFPWIGQTDRQNCIAWQGTLQFLRSSRN